MARPDLDSTVIDEIPTVGKVAAMIILLWIASVTITLVADTVLGPNPSDAHAYGNRAGSWIDSGDLEKAEHDIAKALAMPEGWADPNVWYNLGVLHSKRKQWAEASYAFRYCWQVAPRNDVVNCRQKQKMAEWLARRDRGDE